MTCETVTELVGTRSMQSLRSGCLVDTDCVYPSGTRVKVLISTSDNGFVVSDGGYGIEQVFDLQIEGKKHGWFLARQARRYGVTYKRGEILSLCEDASELDSAISRVASASSIGVAITAENHKPKLTLSSDLLFDDFIKSKFSDRFKQEVILGVSDKGHNFPYVNRPQNPLEDAILIVDPVKPVRMSIDTKCGSLRDVQALDLPNFNCWLIYDDDVDNWAKSDLNYLGAQKLPMMSKQLAEIELQQYVR
ncbi:MAG: hypothetical protein ACPGOV_13805 [Magnetovibrionaceae bacterium]